MAKSSEAKAIGGYETEEREMTEADRVKLGGELATVDRDIIATKEEKKNVNRAYRVKLNKLEERADVLSKQLQDGIIEDSFEVTEEHDDARLVVDIKRRDSGERVSTRQMTEPEKEAARKRKQLDLPIDGDRPKGRGKGKGKAKDDEGIVDDDYATPRDEDTDPGTPKSKGRGRGKGSKR